MVRWEYIDKYFTTESFVGVQVIILIMLITIIPIISIFCYFKMIVLLYIIFVVNVDMLCTKRYVVD